MNWKHGGNIQVGQVKYNVIPTKDRGYSAGVCSFHLYEVESWSGVDGPGTERHHAFTTQIDAKDGNGVEIFKDFTNISDGDNNPYKLFGKYYDTLTIAPKAQGGDYIQFTIGSQSWTTKDSTGIPRCNTGAWDGDYAPSVSDFCIPIFQIIG